MDIGAFCQENRKWLIGCAVGFVVFLIAEQVVGSVYDPAAPGASVRSLMQRNQGPKFTADVVGELQEERDALVAERSRLQQMLAFERSPQFRLQPGVAADEYLFEVGRTLKQGLLDEANARGIDVGEKEVAWSVPTGVDEIGNVLFGLELLDETARRLLAAHDAVLAEDENAIGLRAILQLRTETEKAGRRRQRRGSQGGVDLRDLLTQERLQFKFEADAATTLRFFEACRQPGRTLVIEGVKMIQPERLTDPVTVSGSLLGVAFKEEQS